LKAFITVIKQDKKKTLIKKKDQGKHSSLIKTKQLLSFISFFIFILLKHFEKSKQDKKKTLKSISKKKKTTKKQTKNQKPTKSRKKQ
jgi:hypothetical protein